MPMLLKEKPITIAGHDYKLTQLGALEGRKLWLNVLHLVVEPLKTLGSADKLDEKAVLAALAGALGSLTEETAEKLYDGFGRATRVRVGDKWPELVDATFNLHFAGNYVAMSQWLLESIIFNFADFLGDGSLGSMIAKLQAAASKRVSPKDSIGSSGES